MESAADAHRQWLEAKFERAELPMRYRTGEATFATYEPRSAKQEQAKNAAIALAREGAPPFLFLTGPTGTGKTHLAASALRDRIEQGLSGRFTTLDDLLLRIRSTYNNHGPEAIDEWTLLCRYREAGFLVLDEIGGEKSSEHASQTLYSIINYRYENRLPTILTSNLKPEDMARHLSPDDPVRGERIVDRIREVGRWIHLTGESYRRGKK